MPGALAQLPDTTALARLAGTLQAGVDATARGYGSLGAGDPGSPLGPLAQAVTAIDAQAQVDVAGLVSGLAESLRSLAAGMPPAALEFAESLQQAYREATGFLERNPLLDLLPEGSALRDVAAQVMDEAVELFQRRVTELAGQALDPEALRAVTEALSLMQRLRTDLPGHLEELPGFVAEALLGFRPAELDPLRSHLQATVDVLAGLDAAALSARLDPVRIAAERAEAEVIGAVARLDPTTAAGYEDLVQALDTVADAVTDAAGVLRGLYEGTAERVGGHGWERVLPAYVALLRTVDLAPHLLVDAVLDATAEVLDTLVGRAQAAVAADELVARVEAFAGGLHAAVAGSGIGQLRARLVAVLGEVRDAVAGVPLGGVRQAVVEMLERVGAELDRLDLDAAAATVESGFVELESLVTRTVTQAGTAVQEGLDLVLDQVAALPAGELLAAVRRAVEEVGSVIETLRAGAEAHLDDLEAQVAGLEDLSFRPVGDAVVAELDQIRGRLAAMSPQALSEEEKLLVRAGLAVLEAVDLEGKVVTELTAGFRSLQARVLTVLDDIEGALDRLRRAFGELDPVQLLDPVSSAFDRVRAAVERLDAAGLVEPLRAQAARLDRSLARLAPGELLGPLEEPYEAAVVAVARLDPAVWGAPLGDLHARLAALVDRVDVGPLFAELDERRRNLLASAREALARGAQALELPAPLDAWFGRVRVLLEEITDVLFLDPGEGMRRLAARTADDYALSSLYEPLEAAFEEVLGTLREVPAGDLVTAAAGVRDDLVSALDLLEPERLVFRLRAAHRRLVEVAPAALLAAPLRLPAARAAFRAKVDVAVSTPAGEVARVSARFDAVLALLDTGRPAAPLAELARAHEQALIGLRRAVDGLDVAAAQREWRRLRGQLDRLVPAALLEPGPLTAEQVLAACETWRPSLRSGTLDGRLRGFLDVLAPLADRLDTAFDRFAADLRATAALLDPLALDQAVVEIVDAVREQVAVLAPGELLDTLRADVWLPVSEAVTALDPGALAERLELAYARARATVTSELEKLLDQVEQALAEHLRRARAAVEELLGDVEALTGETTEGIGELVGRVEDLLFVELLARLRTVVANLGTSFDAELSRVRHAFDAMLDAAPVGERIRPQAAAS